MKDQTSEKGVLFESTSLLLYYHVEREVHVFDRDPE